MSEESGAIQKTSEDNLADMDRLYTFLGSLKEAALKTPMANDISIWNIAQVEFSNRPETDALCNLPVLFAKKFGFFKARIKFEKMRLKRM